MASNVRLTRLSSRQYRFRVHLDGLGDSDLQRAVGPQDASAEP